MKPLNLDNRPCSPVSSNCVVWQGPTISCINICNGDTVSDVVAALATELCTLLEQTNVSNYDLTCLGISACGPKDFQALIQLLIDKICELNGITPETGKVTGGCPDCLVSVAPCFQVDNQTNMQLLDYVQMIAEKVCAIIDEIASINIQIANLDDRVTILENTPPPVFTLPSILVDCTLSASIVGGNSYTIDLVLDALVNDDTYGYCSLLGSTGLPADLASAVASACITATTPTISNAPTPYGTQYLGSWVNTPTTVADSINNIWLVLCDYYDYLQNNAIAVADTTTVNLEYTSGVLTAYVQDTDWHDLLGFDFYDTDPTNSIKKPQARRIGNVIYFRGQVTVPLASSTGTVIDYLYKSGTDTYLGVVGGTKAPYQGVGGVVLSPYGGIMFNSNGTTAQSVIPPAVLPAGYVIDGVYQNPAGWKMAYRTMDTGSASTILTTWASVVIGTGGTLNWGLIKDAEESFAIPGNVAAYNTSHMNYIISHVTQGERVPKYSAAGNTVYSNTVAGVQPVELEFSTSEVYPISINANDEDEIGGFHLRIDGHMAFISPCVTVIPTPEPC